MLFMKEDQRLNNNNDRREIGLNLDDRTAGQEVLTEVIAKKYRSERKRFSDFIVARGVLRIGEVGTRGKTIGKSEKPDGLRQNTSLRGKENRTRSSDRIN